MPVKEWVVWKLTDKDIRAAAGTDYCRLNDKSKARIAKNIAKTIFNVANEDYWDVLTDEVDRELV